MELDKAIRKETIENLDKGYSDKESEAMAFISIFSNAEKPEQEALAPMYNTLTEKHSISQKEWHNFEDLVRRGDRDALDPYGYGIEMNSPLGKMIS